LALADIATASASLNWVEAQAAKFSRAKATGGKHKVLLAIHRSHDEIAAMDIQGHIPADRHRSSSS